MSASKTPAEVGRGMEQYDVRTGNDPLPRETNPLNPIHCFDKGHHRVLSRNTLRNVQNDANGPYVVLRGKRIAVQVAGVLGVPLPVGFVAVPKQYILQHFSTRYGRNIVKMKRKLQEYHTEFSQYLRELFAGSDLGRPRRPTLKSLNLDSPTEFESFLVPLKSFFHTRLKRAFASLVRDAEDGQWTMFTNINRLALPDLIGGVPRDQAAEARWNAARDEYIAVRINNFDALAPVMLGPQYPAPRLPFPPNRPAAPNPPGAAPPAPPPTPMDIDKKMLEQCQMGRSTKWKGLFLYMTPWQDAIPVPNPFVSPEYRLAYEVAQNGFSRRYAEFKRSMVAKRRQHSRDWNAYTAYRNEMKSVFMLDTNRRPVNRYAERPQIEHFTEELKHFTFGLKEEMKNFVFVPINVAAAPPGFFGGAYNAFAPNAKAYENISSSVLQSANRMFLI